MLTDYQKVLEVFKINTMTKDGCVFASVDEWNLIADFINNQMDYIEYLEQQIDDMEAE